MMQDSKAHFPAHNSHGHAKEFIRKLSTIWERALKKVRQP
jgi:quinol monooxygenase YgiN